MVPIIAYENILYQSEDAIQQISQLSVSQSDLFPLVGTQSQLLGFCWEGNGGDWQECLPMPWYEEQKLVLESWLYNVDAECLRASFQKSIGERMER